MIIFLDICILVAAVIAVGIQIPVFGVFLLLLGLLFGIQFWKTILLLGSSISSASKIKITQAATFAVLLTICVGSGVLSGEAEPATEMLPEEMWNGPLLPVYLGLALLTALAMIALITERRKR